MLSHRTRSGHRTSRLLLCTVAPAGLILTLVAGTAGVAGAKTSAKLTEAKKHLLVLSDMPKGWTTEKGTGGTGNGTNFPGAAALAGCIGIDPSLITQNPPEIDSPYYESKDQSMEVQDSVSVFPSAKNANASLAAIANAKTPACMSTAMNAPAIKSQIASSAGKGATVGAITVTPIDAASYGKGVAGFTMALPISGPGISVNANLTAVYFVHGNLGQQISFNGYGPPFPAALAQKLTAVAQGRL
jgi:hypothetical protein